MALIHPVTMASTPSNDDRHTTPSAPASRRCTTCGELMRGHNNLPQTFCAQVGALKAYIRQLSESHPDNNHGTPWATVVKSENGQGSSISHGPHGISSATSPRLPTITETEVPNLSQHSDSAVIILPVASQPELKSPFAPILEMRTILRLRSMQLSSFHTTKKGDWGFVVTGGPEAIKEWVAENRLSAQSRMLGKPKRYLTAIMMVLGFLFGGIFRFWISA